MIARIWHGRVPSSLSDDYHAFLLARAVPDYTATVGNRGVQILRRTDGSVTHFLLTTFWESLDAVRRFAGDDHTKARYYPEDDRFLLDKEPTVDHYEVLRER